jgi:hypothetical protein
MYQPAIHPVTQPAKRFVGYVGTCSRFYMSAVLMCCMLWVLMQTSFEDKETGQVLSAVDCYFQCQVRTQPAAGLHHVGCTHVHTGRSMCVPEQAAAAFAVEKGGS